MRISSVKAKGRRLQVEVAETLSVAFNFSIEAIPPTKSGVRENGSRYVLETQNPDLRVRRSGEAGSDLVLLSDRARKILSLDGAEFYVECKCTEKFSPEALFLDPPRLGFLRSAFEQIRRGARNDLFVPIVFVRKNRLPALAVGYWEHWKKPVERASLLDKNLSLFLRTSDLVAFSMPAFITLVKNK